MNKIKLTGILLCAGICTLGAQDTVKASAFGFNQEDATAALQKAIDSGARKVIVDNTGKDWVTRPLLLRSNQEIIFEDGVTLRAKKGEFKGTNDSLINVNNVSNVTIRGEGAVTLAMNKKDYDNPALYKFSEWRHTISIRGGTNIKISGLTLKSSGGDGIYVARGKHLPYSRDITVENVTSGDHYRQGISLISVENMVIRNSRFISTRGTAPQCGIDFEPNYLGERFTNIVIDNCEFSENASAGIMFCIERMKKNSVPVSITVKNSRISSNQYGIVIATREARGEIRVENCQVENNRGIPFLLKEQNDTGLKVILQNVVFRNMSYNDSAAIVLAGGSADIGNLMLDHVKVITQFPVPIEFNGMTGYGITSLSGTLLFGPDPTKLKQFDLAKFVAANSPKPSERAISNRSRKIEIAKLSPLTGKTVVAGEKNRIRKSFRFIQAFSAPGNYPVHFTGFQVGKRKFKMQCLIRDRNGALYDRFSTDKTDFTYHLKVKGDGGMFLFEINPGGHCVSLHPTGSAQTILTEEKVNLFTGRNYRYYFTVPADAEYAAVEVTAETEEPVDVQILNAEGKIVKEVRKVKSAQYIKIPRKKSTRDEIWSIRFPWAREDYAFRICAPSLPLAAAAPENLLIEK